MSDRYDCFVAAVYGRLFILPMKENTIASYRLVHPNMKATEISHKKLAQIVSKQKCLVVPMSHHYMTRGCSIDEYKALVSRGSTVITYNSNNKASLYAEKLNTSENSIVQSSLFKYDMEGLMENIYDTYRYFNELTCYGKSRIDEIYNSGLDIVEKSIMQSDGMWTGAITYSLYYDNNGRIDTMRIGCPLLEEEERKYDRISNNKISLRRLRDNSNFKMLLYYDRVRMKVSYLQEKEG